MALLNSGPESASILPLPPRQPSVGGASVFPDFAFFAKSFEPLVVVLLGVFVLIGRERAR